MCIIYDKKISSDIKIISFDIFRKNIYKIIWNLVKPKSLITNQN